MNGRQQDHDLIRGLVDYTGLTPAALAKRIGVAVSTINRHHNGSAETALGRSTLAKLMSEFPDFPGWISPSVGEGRLAYRGPPVERTDTVDLAEFNVAYGLGGSYIHDLPVEARQRTFSRSWIRQFTEAEFADLFWATGNGTSMTPAILDSDLLLIDTAQRTPRMWDQYWAIDMHGMGMIKALRPGKDGAMRIMSINPDWPEELAYDGEMNVVGRVVAIVRKV